MLDVPIGYFVVGCVCGLMLGAALVFKAWERDVIGLRKNHARALERIDLLESQHAREAIDNLELRDENAELRRALALHVGHPSVSLRPLAPVIDFPQRRGDVS